MGNDKNKGGAVVLDQPEPSPTAQLETQPTPQPAESPEQLAARAERLRREQNIYHRIFPVVGFRASSAERSYDTRNGGKTKNVAAVVLEMADPKTGRPSGIFAKGRIYAELRPGAKKARPVFSFMGNNGQSAIASETEEGRAMWSAFAADVARDYVTWRQAQPVAATMAAADVPELDGIEF